MTRKAVQQESWQSNLRSFSMKVGFQLSLSRAMIDFLCAVSEDVQWDRSLYWSQCGANLLCPDNWMASSKSLWKRGLIVRKTAAEMEELGRKRERSKVMTTDHIKLHGTDQWYEDSYWKLTPAGEAVVSLLKMAGIFVEPDAAINKKSRRA